VETHPVSAQFSSSGSPWIDTCVSAYLNGRLKRDQPASYKALEDGRIPSVRQAAVAARLIHLPARLDALKREWKKATAAELADLEFGRR